MVSGFFVYNDSMRQDTLLFLVDRSAGRICLAMKKRGFGSGKFNGVGGKVGPGEAIEVAAVREANEEIGVVVEQSDLNKVAQLQFHFDGKPDWSIECHTYITERWHGEPTESDEMAPQWWALSDIPYERMWVDDIHWLPRVLVGERLNASFTFSGDGSQILAQDIRPL